ncbi:MAG: hypothetical protein ABWY25_07640 [Paenisporosarcina sp.]
MANITLQPQVLDLALYAGDGAEFRLICTDSADVRVPITGTVMAQVRVDRTAAEDPVVEFASDLTDAAEGIILLSLTGAQTQQMMAHPSTVKEKFSGVWDVQWTPTGEEARTLCQGKIDCVADVTR